MSEAASEIRNVTYAGMAVNAAIAVQKTAEGVAGVKEVHQCRARRYGSAFHADLHVMVDHSLSLVAAHELSHKVKDAILAAGLDVVDVVIHIEPLELTDPAHPQSPLP